MSHETFKVGDLVECVKHPDAFVSAWRRVGQQATITCLYANETIDGRPLHRLRSHVDGKHFLCSERCMRKIPPPQDWVKLCNLTDIPREAVCDHEWIRAGRRESSPSLCLQCGVVNG